MSSTEKDVTLKQMLLDASTFDNVPQLTDNEAEAILACVIDWLEQKKQKIENDMTSTSELAKIGLIDDLIKELSL